MKRRELLQTVSSACIAVGESAVTVTERGGSDQSSRGDRDGVAGSNYSGHRGSGCDTPGASGDALSLRRIGCEMDSERPAERLGGNFPPEFRESGANVQHRTNPYVPVDPQWWNDSNDQAELNDARERGVKEHARDLGMAHRQDKGILELHRYPSGGGAASVEEVARRHRNGNEFKILFFNAALFRVAGQPTQHRDLEQRKQEIGRMLNDRGYDIAGLCEVWYPDQAEAIVENAGELEEVYRNNDAGLEGNNGLLTLVSKDSPGPSDNIESANLGVYPSSSAPTLKGWLHTEINLGPGNIDFFVTHLNHQWNVPDHAADRQAQIGRLIEDGLDEVSSPGNVTVLGGDFNVLGNRVEYDQMIRKLDEEGDLELQDVWLTRGGAVSKTTWFASNKYWRGDGFFEHTGPGGEQEAMEEGDTIRGDTEPHWPWDCENYHENCRCDPYQQTREVEQGDTYETVRIDKNTRLDYVFVEKPKPQHDLNVDIKRVRRRLFPRMTQEAKRRSDLTADQQAAIDCGLEVSDCQLDSIYCNTEQYLSDHMGLELEIVASSAGSG